MVASVQNPADIANLALRRIGYRLRVGSLYDGSQAASMILDIFGQTRDELLRMGNWNFAQGTIAATVLKSAPDNYFDFPWTTDYPQPPWRFELAYPEDCLKVRALKPMPGFIFNPAPTAALFATANDATLSPPAQVILCNLDSPLIVYTRRVTDPTSWEADFVEAFAAALARRIDKVITNTAPGQVEMADEVSSLLVAERTQG